MYHFEDYTRYVTETIGARVPVVRAAERGTLSFTPSGTLTYNAAAHRADSARKSSRTALSRVPR